MNFSIVIPVYNGEQYIEKTIRSAIMQMYNDFEIIVVNDGSTDRTEEIVSEYKSMVRLINKTNGGTASALNKGIEAMSKKSEWFKWLSADDLLYENSLYHVKEEIGKLGENNVKNIFYTHYDIVNHEGNFVKEFIEPDYNKLSSFERNVILLDHYYGNASSSFIHKSMFKEVGLFDETVGYAEDYDFWLRACVLHGMKLHLIPIKSLQYRIHQNQLSSQKALDSFQHAQRIKKKILSQLNKEDQEKYRLGLKTYYNMPIKVRIRRKVRDAMFKIMPRPVSKKILSTYLQNKDARNKNGY